MPVFEFIRAEIQIDILLNSMPVCPCLSCTGESGSEPSSPGVVCAELMWCIHTNR